MRDLTWVRQLSRLVAVKALKSVLPSALKLSGITNCRLTMLRNFMEMPIVLKLLTVAACGVLIFAMGTMIPHGVVHVGGMQLTTSEWWAVGAGPCLLVVALLFCASAVYMLRRSRYGRPSYVVAWIALSISIPYIAGVTGAGVPASRPGFISNLVLTTIIGLYLYLSKGARSYFRAG